MSTSALVRLVIIGLILQGVLATLVAGALALCHRTEMGIIVAFIGQGGSAISGLCALLSNSHQADQKAVTTVQGDQTNITPTPLPPAPQTGATL